MSAFKFKMKLGEVFRAPDPDEDKRFRILARVVARRLNSYYDTLENQGLVFEAGATEALAMRFDDFADGIGGCHEFAKWWDELCDWGETLVGSGTRALCDIPELPLEFSC
jgi:hypothetical protein